MGSVIKKRGRPLGSKNTSKKATQINWERLAKQLQTALNDEIKINNEFEGYINQLKYEVANLEHQAIGYRAVVSYLENKFANHTV